jgi:hypothetical protein
VNAVLREAAKKDAAEALEAVNGLPEDLQTYALGAALVGWAGEHPIDALTWAIANGVDPSEAKASNFGGGSNSLLKAAFESDRTKTLAWLRAQPASSERDLMLLDGYMRGGPVGSSRFTPNSHPGSGQRCREDRFIVSTKRH